MTEKQFNNLSEDEQSDVICRKGVLISLRKENEQKVLLYQIDSFYAEVFYHPVINVINIESFSGTEKLQPYLKQIDLAGIL